jgi:hypothetical protein
VASNPVRSWHVHESPTSPSDNFLLFMIDWPHVWLPEEGKASIILCDWCEYARVRLETDRTKAMSYLIIRNQIFYPPSRVHRERSGASNGSKLLRALFPYCCLQRSWTDPLIRGSTPSFATSFATHLAIARGAYPFLSLDRSNFSLAWLEGRRGNLECPFSAEAIATLGSSLTS